MKNQFEDGKKVSVAMIEKGQKFNLVNTLKHEYTVMDTRKSGNKFSRYATHVEIKRDADEATNWISIDDFVRMINDEVKAGNKENVDKIDDKKKGKVKADVQISEKETSEILPRKLTTPELLAIGHEAGDILALIKATENEAQGIAKSFKSKIAELEAKLSTIQSKLQSGEEWSPVAVRIVYNWTENKRTTIRKDSGEILKETAIPVQDRQTFFTDPGNAMSKTIEEQR